MAGLLKGLHHVTSFAGKPKGNVTFHERVLGAKLVKRTVNFDDPGTLHLYFGNETGSPGTIFTSFPSPKHARGWSGTPEIAAVIVETDAAGLQRARATDGSVETDSAVVIKDPDGLEYRCQVSRDVARGSRVGGAVLRVPDADETRGFLCDVLGFARDGDDAVLDADGAPTARVSFEPADGRTPRFGAGVVHHVAWRVEDEAGQMRVAEALRDAGIAATPVRDRVYFRSIYFRIPGGVLFEVATDEPGFTADEPAESLGERLCLPGWLEERRDELEKRLPAL
ncbi:MAG: VOC family protein [Planctomycetota bacterium]